MTISSPRQKYEAGAAKQRPGLADWRHGLADQQDGTRLETLHWCPEGTVADIYIYRERERETQLECTLGVELGV